MSVGELLDAEEAEFLTRYTLHGDFKPCIVDVRKVQKWTYGGRKKLADLPHAIRAHLGFRIPVRFLVPKHLASAWQTYPLPRKLVFTDLEEAKQSICRQVGAL